MRTWLWLMSGSSSVWRKLVCVVQVSSIKWYQACAHIQYAVYPTYRHKQHTHTRRYRCRYWRWPSAVTVVRDLIMKGEVRVIKYHLNPPTSCEPAISQTPMTDVYTINNAIWSQSVATLPLLRFRFFVWLNVRLKEEILFSSKQTQSWHYQM